MRAVIETGGKQYYVKKGDTLQVELLEGAEGKEITFKNVLLATDGKASSTKIGAPFVSGASVTAKVLGQAKTDKVRVYKMRQRTRYRRNKGHRQNVTKLEITGVNI